MKKTSNIKNGNPVQEILDGIAEWFNSDEEPATQLPNVEQWEVQAVDYVRCPPCQDHDNMPTNWLFIFAAFIAFVILVVSL